MNTTGKERLYNLLPAFYRVRDKKEGEPLRALLAVIDTEIHAIENDIEGLYENWFIETCEDWVVPYIGDLLGVRNLQDIGSAGLSQRAYVANTIAYRRRKGTPSVIEQLARDVTGWHARVVEFFHLLATTQNMNHVLPGNTTLNLHDADGLDLLGGAFERAAHTVDVRRNDKNGGRYNIPNIGIFLWRLRSYSVKRSTAKNVGVTGDQYALYTFNPLGYDAPLFNQPQTERDITHMAEEVNVPGMLRRRALRKDLEEYQEANTNGKVQPDSCYFGDIPVLAVFADGLEIKPEFLMICDLCKWKEPGWKPSESKKFKQHDDTDSMMQVAVDPVLGRLVFLTGPQHTSVEVSYSYGFSSDMGGGPYERELTVAGQENDVWNKTVSIQDNNSRLIADYDSLSKALTDWADPENGNRSNAIITITDNGTYDVNNNTVVDLPAGRFLVIQANSGNRPTIRIIDDEGYVATLPIGGSEGSDTRLILSGLLIEGGIDVTGQSLELVQIVHCTFVPAFRPSVTVAHMNIKVEIDHSITGPLYMPAEIKGLRILDSIIDSPDREQFAISDGIKGPGPSTTIERTTVFGKVRVREMTSASNVIFTDTVTVDHRQQNCVRYSFVPDGSQTSRRYRCQPDLEISKQIEDEENKAQAENISFDTSGRELIRTEVVSRLVPAFTSIRYGDPGYGQLHTSCPEQIRTGADDGSEMGAFHHLKQPQREANLCTALDEYLRFGLEPGILYVDEDKEVCKDETVFEEEEEL
jgi:hypothetical protein